jgi:hypothetical protein
MDIRWMVLREKRVRGGGCLNPTNQPSSPKSRSAHPKEKVSPGKIKLRHGAGFTAAIYLSV